MAYELIHKDITSLAPLLTVEDISHVLKISLSFAYKLLATGQIRSVKIGRSRRVREVDLLDYIDNSLTPNEGKS